MRRIKLTKNQFNAVLNGATKLLLDIDLSYYKNMCIDTLKTNVIQHIIDTNSPYNVNETYFSFKSFIDWTSVEFIIKDIKLKRVQDITHDEVYEFYPTAHKDKYKNFMIGFNEMFCNNKYKENPYKLILTIERTK